MDYDRRRQGRSRRAIDRTRVAGIALALLCIASAALMASADETRVIADLQAQLERNALGPNQDFRITRLLEDAEQSVLLVQIRGTLPPHLHRHTREVVYLIQGEGVFQLDSERFAIRTGAVLRVQPGQVHTFSAAGAAPAVFLVVTSPQWDEKDRIVVQDSPAPKIPP